MSNTILIRPDQTNYDFLYDKEYYGNSLYVNHFIDKKLTGRTIQRGYILPYTPFNEGGIFDSEGVYLNGSSYTEGNHYGFRKSIRASNTNLSTLAEEQGINLSGTVQNHSTVVFIGIMLKVWGHFITNSMRLLWFIGSHEYRDNFSECPIAYFPANDFKLEGNHKRLLEILGINTSLMTPVTKLAKYDKIILRISRQDILILLTEQGILQHQIPENYGLENLLFIFQILQGHNVRR